MNFYVESKVTFIEYKNDTSNPEGVRLGSVWWTIQDLNPEHNGYEPPTLTN